MDCGLGGCGRVPAQSTVTGTVLSGALAAGGSLQTTPGHLCGREDGWVQSLVEKAGLDLSCCGRYSSSSSGGGGGGGGGAVERLPGRVRPQATDQPSGGGAISAPRANDRQVAGRRSAAVGYAPGALDAVQL